MGTSNFQQLLARYEEEGELLRISKQVSPFLIPAAVSHMHARQSAPRASRGASSFDLRRSSMGGKALLFENVEGSEIPLAMNLFGSYRRLEIALGCESDGGLEKIASKIELLVEPKPPRSFSELINLLKRVVPLANIVPKRVKKGRAQEHIKLTQRGEVDLMSLPLPKCWPLDGDPKCVGYPIGAEEAGTLEGGGRYITLAGIHTIHAAEKNNSKPSSHNIGMYRMQLVGANKLAMHSHIHHDGAAHWRSWKRIGEPMPIAICFGGESVLPYAATAPLPPGLTELLMAGYLRQRGIRLVRAKTVPLWVPAESEIVIEGWVSTESGGPGWNPNGTEPLGNGAVFEGPFGDHTGFYSLPDRYPIVDVTAVTHCSNPILPATVVGPPPQEDYCLGKATERIFSPLLKVLVPDIIDYDLPLFGCFHNAAIVSIKKEYSFQARKIMHAIWGAGQMAWTKMIVVVDDSVDVHNQNEVLAAIANNCRWGHDLEKTTGPVDILDHAAPVLGGAGKIGIDATVTWEDEATIDKSAISKVAPLGCEEVYEYLNNKNLVVKEIEVPSLGQGRVVICSVPEETLDSRNKRLESLALSLPKEVELLIAVPEGVALEDLDQCLFEALSHSDGYRDLWFINKLCVIDGGRKNEGELRFDRPTRAWPPPLYFDKETIVELNKRAVEFEIDVEVLKKEAVRSKVIF